MIDIDRISQSPFIIFKGQKTHDDEPIKKPRNILKITLKKKLPLTSWHPCLRWEEEIWSAGLRKPLPIQ